MLILFLYGLNFFSSKMDRAKCFNKLYEKDDKKKTLYHLREITTLYLSLKSKYIGNFVDKESIKLLIL